MSARAAVAGSPAGAKQIDLGHSVHDLCTHYPELKEILHGLGFVDILKPGMLQTAGRFMTLPNGARMKGIPLDVLRARLEEAGFEPVE
ncbi:MAG: DUF1858 domain-containing protein [Clostridiaceae bacterium]|nr:DUF1858 domain-containing protein [Clostridiaceae bacterium]